MSFELLSRQEVPALGLVCEDYRHKVTGARHIHLDNGKSHNAFNVVFRTMPEDSSGVAHIIEHCVLQGSERFPVHEVFTHMGNRSFSSFMNAMTGPDATSYPFASCNRKDFDNLLQVYLDCLFFPLLTELDFRQEGHRLEFRDPADPNSGLVIHGVVYNEMKGAMSSPVRRFYAGLDKHLFPSLFYRHNSGGEPACIPHLSYEAFRAFHATYYHPSNAIFLTVGDIPAGDHQQRFEELVLKRFPGPGDTFSIPREKYYDKPVRCSAPYPCAAESLAGQTYIALAWLLGPASDLDACMDAEFLQQVLMTGSASPLMRALEASDLGKAPFGNYVRSDTSELQFVTGMQGSDRQHAEAIEELILGVLQQVAEEGLPREDIDRALHQLELDHRNTEDSSWMPFLLELLERAGERVLHGGDPVEGINQGPALDRLRARLEDPAYLKLLVKRLLLENPHRVNYSLVPDAEMAAREVETESAWLKERAQKLEDAEREHIVSQAVELRKKQQEEEDLDQLPRLRLSEVTDDPDYPQAQVHDVAGKELQFYPCGSNGIAWMELTFPLPQLAIEDLPRLSILLRILDKLGCAGEDFLATAERQQRLGVAPSAAAILGFDPGDSDSPLGWVTLGGRCLYPNFREYCELMCDTLQKVDFSDTSRVKDLLRRRLTLLEREAANGNAMLNGLNAAARTGSGSAELFYHFNSMPVVDALRDMLQSDENVLQAIADFRRLLDLLLKQKAKVFLAAEEERFASLKLELEASLGRLSGEGESMCTAAPGSRQPQHQGWSGATAIAYNFMAWPALKPDHELTPASMVLCQLLEQGLLHRQVREEGGAYGVGLRLHFGSLVCWSYRDPRIEATLKDFANAAEWMKHGAISEDLLENAKLAVLRTLDGPLSEVSDATGDYHAKLLGRTQELRRKRRREVIAVSIDDVRRAAAELMLPGRASRCVIASAQALEGAGIENLEIQEL